MAEVYRNGEFAGLIVEENHQYRFTYDNTYFNDSTKKAISLTLPKIQKEYLSDVLFPFFFNMISEGINKKLQSKMLRIDEHDHFGFLLATAQDDNIGAITVKPIKS